MPCSARSLTLLTAIASTIAVAATARWADRWSVVTVTLLLALTWAAAVSLADAFSVWRRRETRQHADGRRAAVTFVIRLGDEHPDIARTSIVLAAQAGPVVVVATRHREVLDELGDIEVCECVASTIAEALHDAALAIDTDAVLVLSASALPVRDACESAAAQIGARIGWITGTALAFNNDRYAPGERQLMAAGARGAARGLGLVTWEPDATIVRTSLLREHPMEPGRPDGSGLRARAEEGWIGVVSPDVLAVRAAPADAPVFWPSEIRSERGVVADLADATVSGPVRTRVLAAGPLLRELYAYPMAMWLLVFVLVGRSGAFPLSVSALAYFPGMGALAVARWISSRLAYGVGLHPVDEAREAAYDLPGSALALRSALTRKVRSTRLEIPDQPLLWVAFVLTLVATIPLLDRRAPTGAAIGIAVGLTLATLTVTWVFALRALGRGGWDRASYRVAIDCTATIDGRPVRTVDASPSGLAVIGAPGALIRGSRAAVSVAFDDHTVATMHGQVTDLRRVGDRIAVGLALDLDPRERVTWVRGLFAVAGLTGRVLSLPGTPAARPHLALDRKRPTMRHRFSAGLRIAGVGAISMLVSGALLLAFLGYRPMVVRSGSMVPTFSVGDVVIADWIRADHLRVGEVVTFSADIGRRQLVTHRVQSVRVRGEKLDVVTKGDANTTSEQWTVPRGTLVGHVIWTVPRVGTALVVLGESRTRRLLLGTSGLVIVFGILAGLRRSRRPAVSPTCGE
jgi:signal peptidase I